MDKDELKSCLFEALMRMVAPSMGAEERRDMLDCFFPSGRALDGEVLDAFAQGIMPPPREFFAKWVAVFIEGALYGLPPEQLEAACADDNTARTKLYLAWLDFSREHQADMDRDLEGLRLECLTKTRQ